MQRMVANETGPGSFCCLSWQPPSWLVLPALEHNHCQTVCVCARVFGLRELGRNKCFSSSEQDFLAGFRRTRRKNSIWRPLPESAWGIWWLLLPRGHLGMPMVGVHILGMTPGDSKREEKNLPIWGTSGWVLELPSKLSLCQAATGCCAPRVSVISRGG